jgi:hypothetical protein
VHGLARFGALAIDASGTTAFASALDVDLGGLETLLSLQSVPTVTTLRSPFAVDQLRVLGTFDGSVTADITNPRYGTTYSSSNPGIASVSPTGQVTARQPGQAVITAQFRHLSASTTVTVTFDPVTGYGIGQQGTGRIRPRIGTNGQIATLGSANFSIVVDRVLGGAFGLLLVGFNADQTVLGNIQLWLNPNQVTVIPLFASNPGAGSGAGAASHHLSIPNNPSFLGLSLHWQALFLDADGANGVSSTCGLRTTVVP